jgi:hypothetical protein
MRRVRDRAAPEFKSRGPRPMSAALAATLAVEEGLIRHLAS